MYQGCNMTQYSKMEIYYIQFSIQFNFNSIKKCILSYQYSWMYTIHICPQGIQYIYAHKESQYWQVNSIKWIFASFYNPVLCQRDICYIITSMVRQRGKETQIWVYEIIKMECMYMCIGWMVKCCWDSHKIHRSLLIATVQCNTLQNYTINSLRAKFISWTNKCIWHGTGSGNRSSCKTRSTV